MQSETKGSALKRFYIATLGCKVNQYESHALRESWQAGGWRETHAPEEADRILVNSCAVTAKAVADVRNAIRRLHRASPEAEILVTGCAAQVLGKELVELPGVSAVIRQDDKASLLVKNPPAEGVQVAHTPSSGAAFPPFSLSGYDRSRAVLKIQDGCSHGCTYCIVPLTRGRARSRSFADSLAEAERLLASGFREITLSGVNLRQYRDDEKRDFWDFIAALEKALAPRWAGKARLRISSLEPGQLTEKALDTLAASRLVAPHLHLSLQSGSPSVLRRMGRGHYAPDGIPVFLNSLKAVWPVFGLGADLLTGFPGESDTEFADGLAFCSALPLSYAHVFPYSRRPGTAAAALPGQIPHEVKKERAATLRRLVAGKKGAFLSSLLDLAQMKVVFEGGQGEKQPLYQGVNEFYADCCLMPETARTAPPIGALAPVKAVQYDGTRLWVRVLQA